MIRLISRKSAMYSVCSDDRPTWCSLKLTVASGPFLSMMQKPAWHSPVDMIGLLLASAMPIGIELPSAENFMPLFWCCSIHLIIHIASLKAAMKMCVLRNPKCWFRILILGAHVVLPREWVPLRADILLLEPKLILRDRLPCPLIPSILDWMVRWQVLSVICLWKPEGSIPRM